MRIEFFLMVLFFIAMLIVHKRREANKDWERDL